MNENISEYDTMVLAGGSLNNITILGSLQYLKDNNMINNIQTYIGTSSGAIICYLLIIGYTPIEIIVYLCINNQLFEKLKCFDLLNAIRGEGGVSFLYIADQIEKMTIEKIGRLLTLKDLETIYKKRLICVTYNVTKNCIEYINSETNPDIPCLIALHMTCNLPLIFENFKYGDSFYIDGGIGNNFAIDIADKYGKNIIGICLKYKLTNDIQSANILEYVYNLLMIPAIQIQKIRIDNKSESDTIIELLNEHETKIFDFNIKPKMKLEMFSRGYEDTKKFFNK